MAGVNTKLIKRRLKSVTSTKKITKAMELVSAAKMRRTAASAVNARPFASISQEMLQTITEHENINHHPLVVERPGNKILMVLLTPNRGLCGGLNANLFKALHAWQKEHTPNKITAIIVGKKGESMVKKLQWQILAAFGETSDTPSWQELAPVVNMVVKEYAENDFCKVFITATDFISALNQKPFIDQILPLKFSTAEAKDKIKPAEYLFEPNLSTVIDVLLPRLLETKIYQASLEAAASEHSSRMMAMRNAGEAAEEMIDDLVFTYNQARQASITQEIAEVAGGAAAMQN